MKEGLRMVALLPGSRWIRRNGKHAGSEIVVDHVTDTAVFLRELGGGAAMGKQKVDQSAVHRMTTGSFKVTYTAKRELEASNGHGGGSFRRHATAPTAIQDELPLASPPLQLNGYVFSGGSQLNIEVQEITPDMARSWLARGGTNRKLTARLVARIAAAIRRGEWILTGDSIKLDSEQRVIDGQHRLQAIVEAGIPVTSVVVRNVESEAQDVIDTGRSRAATDVLSLHGYANTTAIAACVKLLLMIERFGRTNVSSRQANLLVSNTNILRYTEQHPDVLDGVQAANNLRSAGGLGGGGGLLAVFVVLISRVDAEAAHWFVASLETGANLEVTSPILKLRTRLLAERHTGRGSGIHGQDAREALLAMCIKAWNAWRRGESMQMLIWRERESFPVPE
jgi:hypothetical protein